LAKKSPAEAGWEGHLTLELSNSSGADCRIYAGEGICQLLFFEGSVCDVESPRAGKGRFPH
jgi:dCTP deaminase